MLRRRGRARACEAFALARPERFEMLLKLAVLESHCRTEPRLKPLQRGTRFLDREPKLRKVRVVDCHGALYGRDSRRLSSAKHAGPEDTGKTPMLRRFRQRGRRRADRGAGSSG